MMLITHAGMIAYVPSWSATSIAPRTLHQSFQRSPTHVCTVWLQHSFPLPVALALLCIQYEYFMLVCLSMIRLPCKHSQCALFFKHISKKIYLTCFVQPWSSKVVCLQYWKTLLLKDKNSMWLLYLKDSAVSSDSWPSLTSFSFRLQKMCKIANTISNESTLHAIVDTARG